MITMVYVSREIISERCKDCSHLSGGDHTYVCGAMQQTIEMLDQFAFDSLRRDCQGPYQTKEEPLRLRLLAHPR